LNPVRVFLLSITLKKELTEKLVISLPPIPNRVLRNFGSAKKLKTKN
jgi:hypothetical protein